MITLRLSHKKNGKCEFKKYVKVVLKKKKKKKHHQMKKLLMKCIEIFLIYIYINFFESIKQRDCYKFLSLKVHFTLNILIFCIDFLINHMFKDIHRWAY
jgi:hypothetical protein